MSVEVEAIDAMWISPLRFLVAPRILALFALMPCLALISSLAAILATSLISRAYFNIAFVYFNDLVLNALLIRDIVTGVVKSFLFGLLIAAIACFGGLNVKGGAAGVGVRGALTGPCGNTPPRSGIARPRSAAPRSVRRPRR